MLLHIFCTILEQTCIYIPLILGAYCSFSLLNVPFLAIESAYVFGALMASNIVSLNLPSFLVLILSCISALIGGMLVGLVTYSIKYYLRISFLLASIISMGLFHGINQLIINGAHISLRTSGDLLSFIPSLSAYPQLTTLFMFAVLIIGLFFYFKKSALGVSCSIYGNNSDFFEHYNISGNFVQLAGISISSMLAGISGFFSAGMNGFADISMGFGINLLCITVLILGRTFTKNKFTVAIPIIGVGTYFIMQQMLLRINFDSRYFTMVQAIVVFVILLLTQSFAKGKNYELGL